MILLHPELAVGQEEIFGLILSVIEAAGAPCRMMSLPAVVEIKCLLTIEESQSFSFIVNGMRMHDIHDYRYTESMCVIHKGLELFRSTETGAECEEVGHLIAEGTVVRMFLKGHYLKGVVAEIRHFREHILPELFECTDLFFLGSHAYMAFIDERVRSFARIGVFPLVRLRIPDLGTELLCDRILDCTCGVCRYSLSSPARPLYIKFVECAVVEKHGWKGNLPVSSAYRSEGIGFRTFPVVEFTDQVNLGGIGSPFTEDPVSFCITVHAIVDMVVDAF